MLGQGWLVCLSRWGLISLNPDARLSPRLFSSVQGTSRQMGAHGNVCHCARVRPAMQMILQALARDSWSLCRFIHLTPGRPGHSGPACVFHADELSALWSWAAHPPPVPASHSTFQGWFLLSADSEENTTKSVQRSRNPSKKYISELGVSDLLS